MGTITAAAISAFIATTSASIKILNKIRETIESKTIKNDIMEITAQITEGNGLILQLQAELAEARAELAKAMAKDNLLADYTLVKIGTGYAYRLNPRDKRMNRHNEPVHYICQSCADNHGFRTLLHPLNRNDLYCSECEKIVADRIPQTIMERL